MGYEESPVERAIREAMERGKFDNLPGKGKPLPPSDDALTPPELRLVHKVLKNAHVPPDWMQVQEEVRKERAAVTALWERFEKEYASRHARAEAMGLRREERRRAFAEWHADLRAGLERRMRRVNSDILTLNLKAPTGTRPEIPFKVDEEMQRFDARYPGLPGLTVERAAPEQKKDIETLLRYAFASRFKSR